MGVSKLVLCFLLCASEPSSSPLPYVHEPKGPEPVTVTRCHSGYRYPQDGWIVVHIEGGPYERGFQHGRLLAGEIVDYLKALANSHGPKDPAEAWKHARLLIDALFLRRYDNEYLEEMKGIADGAATAGAKFEGRPIDLIDVVALNSGVELDFLDAALEANPTGLEGKTFVEPLRIAPRQAPPPHCSAFAATAPATASGEIVLGHITMSDLYHVRHYNVWLDVKPTRGHRVLMQTSPGGIMSGMDYYLSDAGMIVAETTIRQTRFDIQGTSLCSRIRKALQYGDSIDAVVATLRQSNNGLYTNEWLLGDIKTNEIAMLELGTHQSKLRRSSKKEWLAGTEGFFWGCNNTKSLNVRLETIPGVEGKPANLVFRPSDRDKSWLALFEPARGKIDAAFGFRAFTTPPIAAFPSCDAKFTTAKMAKELKTYALFGPPLGRTWEPTDEERRRHSDIRPLVANDWTILSPESPAEVKSPLLAADSVLDAEGKLRKHSDKDDEERDTVLAALAKRPAWHGTVLPKSDADAWLTAAFAEYEHVVALEKALKQSGKNAEESKRLLDLALFRFRSRSTTAANRLGKDVALAATAADWQRSEWYDVAVGKGVLLLADLRGRLGAEAFDPFMDQFGRAHAGQEVSTDHFVRHVARAAGNKLPKGYFDAALQRADTSASAVAANTVWSIDSFEEDPGQSLIVFGTSGERHAQEECAQRLQRQIARRWGNHTLPIKSDAAVTEEELRSRHLLLIGRPGAHRLLARFQAHLPIAMSEQSFTIQGKVYSHPASAVVVAMPNPLSSRHSAVVLAGLSAEATWRIPDNLSRGTPPCAALLLPSGEMPKPMVLDHGAKAELPPTKTAQR